MLKKIFFCLFVMMSINIYALTMSIKEKPVMLDNEWVSDSVQDINGNTACAVRIITEMVDLAFDSSNGIVKVEQPIPGVYRIYLQARDRWLKIGAKGYEPLQIYFNSYGILLEGGKVYEIKLTGEKIKEKYNVTILTKPDDAEKIIDNINMGNGKTFNLEEGEHILKIVKEGYRTKNELIKVDKDNFLFDNIVLEEIEQQELYIKSIPDKAEIYINNQLKGPTNKGLYVYPGKCTVELRKEGYITIKEEIEIEEREYIYEKKLVKNAGYIKIDIEPKDATVTINGKEYKEREIELLPAEYEIEISKRDYIKQSEKIKINIGETIEKKYNLIKNTGYLKMDIIPSDAQVSIKGRRYREKMIELTPGEYDIEIFKNGYVTQNQRVKINIGDTVERKYILEKNTGILDINVIPSDARLFINREEYKNKRNELAPGNYRIEIEKENHEKITENIQIERGAVIEKNYEMVKMTGRLRYNVVPLEAETELIKDGESIEKWVGMKSFGQIEAGEYLLFVKAAGYKSKVGKIYISKGETNEVEIELSKEEIPKEEITKEEVPKEEMPKEKTKESTQWGIKTEKEETKEIKYEENEMIRVIGEEKPKKNKLNIGIGGGGKMLMISKYELTTFGIGLNFNYKKDRFIFNGFYEYGTGEKNVKYDIQGFGGGVEYSVIKYLNIGGGYEGGYVKDKDGYAADLSGAFINVSVPFEFDKFYLKLEGKNTFSGKISAGLSIGGAI